MPSSSRNARSVLHHVRDGDHREVQTVRPSCRRVDRRRPRGPAAAAEQVRGDDEVPIRVECLAGADHPVPPAEPLAGRAVAVVGPEPVAGALLCRLLREAGRVGVTAERVADQDHVVPLGRERAVGLVGDADRVELLSAVEPHRVRQVEKLRLDGSDRACRQRRGCRRGRGHSSLRGVTDVYFLGFLIWKADYVREGSEAR